MSYLSRVQIDTTSYYKMKRLSDWSGYHRWVEESFPAEIKNHERLRHLWRIDSVAGKKYLLVVSDNQPDLNRLEWCGIPKTAQTKRYDPYLDQITNAEKFSFRLVANPTRSKFVADQERGKVRPLVDKNDQQAWLNHQAAKFGFKVEQPENSTVVDYSYVPLLRGTKLIRLSMVTFEGQLRVTDPTLLSHALTQGIGREKAFGMGMLTIIPAR